MTSRTVHSVTSVPIALRIFALLTALFSGGVLVGADEDPCRVAQQQIQSGDAEAAIPTLEHLHQAGEACAGPFLLRAYLMTYRHQQGVALGEELSRKDSVPVHLVVAEAFAEAGFLNRALELLGGLQEADPESVPVLRARARFLFSVGDSKAAAECCRQALTRSNGDVGVQYLLGASLARVGKLDEARASLESALEQNPRHSLARLELSRLHSRQRRYAEAVAGLRLFLRHDSHHAGALFALGNALVRSGEKAEGLRALERFQVENTRAEARKDLEEGARSNPGNLEALTDLGLLYRDQRDALAALPVLSRAMTLIRGVETPAPADELKLRKQLAELSLARGQVLRQLGRNKEAVLALKFAMKVDDSQDAARLEIAEILSGAGRYRDAQRILDGFRQSLAGERVSLLQAELLGRRGEGWFALAVPLRRAVEDQFSLEAALGWVDAAVAFGAHDDARLGLDLWIDQQAEDVPLRLARAVVELQVGALQEAGKRLSEVLSLDPLYAPVHEFLAEWHQKEGREAEARLARRRSVELRYLLAD